MLSLDQVAGAVNVAFYTGATVEDNVFIGAGVTIAGPLTVGKGARVGAGSVVVEPVKAGATVFGNPAKSI